MNNKTKATSANKASVAVNDDVDLVKDNRNSVGTTTIVVGDVEKTQNIDRAGNCDATMAVTTTHSTTVAVQHVGLSTMDTKRLLPPPPPMPITTAVTVTALDLQEIEDLRKKRCADRYDSSESSDR